MALIDEDRTWIALNGTNYNKTISTTGTAANATITRTPTEGVAMVRVWGDVPFHFTWTQGTTATTATTNSSAMPSWHVEYFPITGASASISTIRVATSGNVYASLVKAG